MSRKFDRQRHINQKALEIIQDPYTLFMLGSKLIRKKPKLVPRFDWNATEFPQRIELTARGIKTIVTTEWADKDRKTQIAGPEQG